MLKATNKIEINYNSIQKVTYSNPLFTLGNFTSNRAGNSGGYRPSTTPNSPQHRNQNLTQQANKLCNKVQKLVNNNFHPYRSLFVTVTFANSKMTDLTVCNKEFQQFLAKIKRHYEDFAYVAVVSFQDRGVPHYHMVCNLPTESTKYLRHWWTHGSIHSKKTTGVYGISHYMIKNLRYNFTYIKLPKHYRLHFASKNLNKSVVLREWNGTEIADYYMNIARINGLDSGYTKKIDSDYCGNITYQTYHIVSADNFPLKPVAILSNPVRMKNSNDRKPFP